MTRLAEVMQEKRVAVDVLAKAVGSSRRTVYRHAKGETSMTLLQAHAYAKALGVGIDELVGERVEA